MALSKLVIFGALLLLEMWASSARTLPDASMAERHEQWMARYGHTYKDDVEKATRLQIFKDNVEYIESFNSAGNRTYKLGINKFTDMTSEEFKATKTGYKMEPAYQNSISSKFRYADVGEEVPSQVDWREKGAVTEVKNQHQCGCCWAFSAVAAIEGIIQIRQGNLISLSEQLLDFIQRVPANDESALRAAVANQPVSVTIDSDQFQHYASGVFAEDCGTDLNHAVTAVGYGETNDGMKYWLVKNSWGTTWGENGYMKILRDVDDPRGLCGLAMQASYPTA